MLILLFAPETAENIGYSCNLLREEMNEIFIIAGNSPEDVREELRSERGAKEKSQMLIELFHVCRVSKMLYFLMKTEMPGPP